MNTTEQAREVSKRLRNADQHIGAADLINKLFKLMGRGADAIDALLAELATLKDAHVLMSAAMAVMVNEANALKNQEPVAWGIVASNTGRICQVELDASEVEGHKTQYIRPLYLAAGAQPVPPGYQLVPIEPTPEMLSASYYPDCNAPKRKEIYQAMLAAAKEQP